MTGASSRTQITLPSDCELAMTRTFNAPQAMVFDAWTTPELLKRWWGPPDWTLPVCEIDLRVGGAWRYVMRNSKGAEMTLRGVYREIARPERLVHTQLLDGCVGQGDAEALCTATFVEHTGATTYTGIARYPTKQVRDAVLNAGTTGPGMDSVFDRLAQLLESSLTVGHHGAHR